MSTPDSNTASKGPGNPAGPDPLKSDEQAELQGYAFSDNFLLQGYVEAPPGLGEPAKPVADSILHKVLLDSNVNDIVLEGSVDGRSGTCNPAPVAAPNAIDEDDSGSESSLSNELREPISRLDHEKGKRSSSASTNMKEANLEQDDNLDSKEELLQKYLESMGSRARNNVVSVHGSPGRNMHEGEFSLFGEGKVKESNRKSVVGAADYRAKTASALKRKSVRASMIQDYPKDSPKDLPEDSSTNQRNSSIPPVESQSFFYQLDNRPKELEEIPPPVDAVRNSRPNSRIHHHESSRRGSVGAHPVVICDQPVEAEREKEGLCEKKSDTLSGQTISVPVDEFQLADRPRSQLETDGEYDSDSSSVVSFKFSIERFFRKKWVIELLAVILLVIIVMGIGICMRILVPKARQNCAPVLTWCLTISISLLAIPMSRFVVHIIVWCLEQFFFLNENVIYYTMGVRVPLKYFIWSVITILNWRFTMTYNYSDDDCNFNPSGDLWWVLSILGCVVVTTFCFTVKGYYVKKLANSYHQKAYFERIHQSLFAEFVISSLSVERPLYSGTKPRPEEKADCEPATVVDEASKNYQQIDSKFSLFQFRKIAAFVRNNPFGASFTSRLANLNNAKVEEAASPAQAKRLAKQIFKKVKQPGQKVIHYSDFVPYFRKEKDLQKGFALFDINGDGTISKRELIDAMLNLFKERKALAYGLADSKNIVMTLDNVLTAALMTILFFVYLFIFNVDVLKVILSLTTIIVAFAFAFGESIKQVYEATIFIFVVHPFDVGDRIQFPDYGGLYVSRINLQFTEFDRWDGQKIYFPNTVLMKTPIYNANRSAHMWDSIEFHIGYETSNDKILVLRQTLIQYVVKAPLEFYPECDMVVTDVENCNRLRLCMWVQHRMNFQRTGLRSTRRMGLLLFIKETTDNLGITYYPPVQRFQRMDNMLEDGMTPLRRWAAAEHGGNTREGSSVGGRVV